MIIKYYKYIKAFCTIAFSLKEFEQFLMRESEPNQGLKSVASVVHGRMMNEQRGRHRMSRENTLIYLMVEAFKETDARLQKDDLLTLVSLLLVWYCEPIKEIPTEKE